MYVVWNLKYMNLNLNLNWQAFLWSTTRPDDRNKDEQRQQNERGLDKFYTECSHGKHPQSDRKSYIDREKHPCCFGNQKEDTRGHYENATSRKKKDEAAIQAMMACIDEWDSDPWDPKNSVLQTLQSGKIASKELCADFRSARADGEEQVTQFLKERILSNKKRLLDTLKRNKRKNFLEIQQRKSNSMEVANTVMDNKAMVELITIAQRYKLDLDLIMEYRLTEMPLAIFNSNGSMRKVVKSKLQEQLTFTEVIMPAPSSYYGIIDMGFLWRRAIPSREERELQDGDKYTWNDYARKLFWMAVNRHPGAFQLHLVNDRYDIHDSIKDSEHQRRSAVYVGGSRNVFIKPEAPLPSTNDLGNFFTNPQNKVRLQEFLFLQFKVFAEQLENQKMIYTLKDKCFDLTTGTEIYSYQCHQHEADTRMFFHAHKISSGDSEIPIVIDAEDTDVIALAAFSSYRIASPLLLYKKGKIYDCRKLCSPGMSSILLQLHVYTGADCVSGFYGHGKTSIFATVAKSEEAQKILEPLGSHIEVANDLIVNLQLFTRRFIYGDVRSDTMASHEQPNGMA